MTANKGMSLEETIVLLNQTKRQGGSHNEEIRWPDHYRSVIAQAVEHGADQIMLGTRWFDITYRGDRFRLHPKEGFVPTGWFNRSWLKEV